MPASPSRALTGLVAAALAGSVLAFAPAAPTPGVQPDDVPEVAAVLAPDGTWIRTINGMTDRFGPVVFEPGRRQAFLGDGDAPGPSQRPYSDETAREIDEEVRSIIDAAEGRVRELLKERESALRANPEKIARIRHQCPCEMINGLGHKDDLATAVARKHYMAPDMVGRRTWDTAAMAMRAPISRATACSGTVSGE